MQEQDILVGSELFINDGDKPDQIRSWVRQMYEARLKVIRLFVTWSQVQPQEDIWDFLQYDAVFDEAEVCGLYVIPTFMSVNPPQWLKKYGLYDDQGDMDNPEYLKWAGKYIQVVTERYVASPVLHSWILWNEPTRTIQPGPFSLKAFEEYMEQKYPGREDIIREIKAGMGEESKLVAGDVNAARNITSDMEWTWFSVANMEKQLTWIRNQIREIDPLHPVHVNPHMTGYNHMIEGQSPWMEGRVADFMGSSVHPVWHSNRFLPERVDQSVAYFADLMKSCTRAENRYFWVTEMQGGPTVVSGDYPSCPSPEDIRHWMWESIGAGSKGIVFWCFNTRDTGMEAGEWGLLNQAGKPSKRLKAVTDVCKVLEENREVFSDTGLQKEDVYIFYSETSMNVAWSQGAADWSPIRGDDIEDPRNQNQVLDAVVGAYLMCSDLGLEVLFVDETLLLEGKLDRDIPLIMPNVFAGEDRIWNAVEDFVREGGFVITDGLTGMKTAKGDINRQIKPLTDRVLGPLEEVEGYRNEFELCKDGRGYTCIGWHMKCTFAEEEYVRVLQRDQEGDPVVIITEYGKGKTLRIGTVFFQRYLSHPIKEQIHFFADWTSIYPKKSVRLKNGCHELRMRSLLTSSGELLIILNRGSAKCAELESRVKGQLMELDSTHIADLTPGDSISLGLEPGQIRLLKLCIDK